MHMTHIVSITSQGQISIPAKLRRQFGLDKYRKARIVADGRRIVIEPIPDIMALSGILHHKAKKGMTIHQIMKLEQKAIEEGFTERYRRFMKKKST